MITTDGKTDIQHNDLFNKEGLYIRESSQSTLGFYLFILYMIVSVTVPIYTEREHEIHFYVHDS